MILVDFLPKSLDTLMLSIAIVMLLYKYEKTFKKFEVHLYLIAFVYSILSVFFFDNRFLYLIDTGSLGLAFLLTVMFAGTMSGKFALTKLLRRNRKMLSILGFILIVPHGFINLFVQKQIGLFGIGAVVIMIPLFITSFRVIKREIKAHDWKMLHKLSYFAYLAIYIHIIIMGDWINKITYSVLFALYINNKLIKELGK
jgi:DMSO/TMAO reductase YedYZ heme-binding membrane subunit